MKEKVFSVFRVWDKNTLTERAVLDAADEIFRDIAETHELPSASYVKSVDVKILESGEKEYVFEIVASDILPMRH